MFIKRASGEGYIWCPAGSHQAGRLEKYMKQLAAEEYRSKLYFEQVRKKENRIKHQDEKCLNCDKHIDEDEWFCYCSLCPECYLQTPEEELDKIDERIEKIADEY